MQALTISLTEFVNEWCRHSCVEPSFVEALIINVTKCDFLLLNNSDVGDKINSAFQSTQSVKAYDFVVSEIVIESQLDQNTSECEDNDLYEYESTLMQELCSLFLEIWFRSHSAAQALSLYGWSLETIGRAASSVTGWELSLKTLQELRLTVQE